MSTKNLGAWRCEQRGSTVGGASGRRRRRRTWPVVALVVGLAAVAAFAASGNLDPEFGTDGLVVTTGNDGRSRDVAVDAWGRIVVAGQAPTSSSRGWWIRRYQLDGQDDETFGTGGLVELFDGSDEAYAVAVDASDQVLAVGLTTVTTGTGKKTVSTRTGTLVRLTEIGALDTSFGAGGIVRPAVPRATETRPVDVTILGDSILVAGRAAFNVKGQSVAYPFVARYTKDGGLDTGFGSAGFAVDKRAPTPSSIVGSLPLRMAVQSDGGILLMAMGGVAPTTLTRLTANGGLDTGFGLVTSDDYGHDLAIDGDDGIVLVGRRVFGTGLADIAVWRYEADGDLDAAFGGATFGLYDYQWPHQIVIQADGKIVVSAEFRLPGSRTEAATVRFTQDGDLDDTYGNGGVGDMVALGSGLNVPDGLALTPDGGGVVMLLTSGSPGTWGNWVLARYLLED